jgi:S1-C subfamily serine protease
VIEGNAKVLRAGNREAGALCAQCGRELQADEEVAVCNDCGAVHHLGCWQTAGGCGSYECAKSGAYAAPRPLEKLTITSAELAAAEPLAPPKNINSTYEPPAPPPRRWNRAAVWAFFISLVGIPLFGLVTGAIAIIIACIGLAGHTSNRRGAALGAAAILIGLLEVVGWAVGLSYYLGGGAVGVIAMNEMTLDPDSLKELPDRIARAMRANVLIQSNFGFGRQGIGSGVILKVRDGSAYIVTNRHVVDPNFSEGPEAVNAPADMKKMADISVMTVGQSTVPGTVEWVAPHGVDLAILAVPLLGAADEVQEALWNDRETPHVGDPVFAVGNPHGLGWTHSAGSVSQVRRRAKGDFEFRVLQSTAAINPGNSGGGLYDADGRLIGINTFTGDKRVAEGLGFSIAFPTLLELIPDSIELPDVNHAADAEANEEDGSKREGEATQDVEKAEE